MKTLSDKIDYTCSVNDGTVIRTKDVKDFIQELKNKLTHEIDWNKKVNDLELRAIIDSIAGDELI